MNTLRRNHMKMAVTYIIRQTKNNSLGTVGAEFVPFLSKIKKEARIVMLTGYGNLPTAVAAVKAGAIDYIAKPVDADNVEAALLAAPDSKANPPENPIRISALSLNFFFSG